MLVPRPCAIRRPARGITVQDPRRCPAPLPTPAVWLLVFVATASVGTSGPLGATMGRTAPHKRNKHKKRPDPPEPDPAVFKDVFFSCSLSPPPPPGGSRGRVWSVVGFWAGSGRVNLIFT